VNERIRFHLDEPVDPVIARTLRQHGVNVTTTAEAGLRGQSDDAQINFARAEGRVIVTHDAEFLRFARENSDHPGIAYCHKTRR
jgi:predicted nuclease of predicted toxin-antitoxin system